MDKCLTLGSLFSGSGAFELAATRLGIKPVWASEVEPFPIAVTRKHFPDMIHLGDINRINGAAIPPVDIVTGGFCCFPAGTMVFTDKGYVPIEELRAGDTVLTHKNNWRKITATGSRPADTIVLKGNTTLETTAEHPIYSADIKHYYPTYKDGKRGQIKQLIDVGKWTNAADMLQKQWSTPREVSPLPIPQPDYIGYNKKVKPMPEMNSAFFYFLGRWLGDGWTANNQRTGRPQGQKAGHICLCDSLEKEDELIAAVSEISENFCVSRHRTVCRITFASVIFADWLDTHFGKGAKNKHIPAWVFGLPEDSRRAVFNGIKDSDGFCKDGNIKVTSISKRLVLGIRLLAETLGYSTSVSYFKRPETTVIEGREVHQNDTYTVACVDSERKTNMPDGFHTWYKCRSVTASGERKTVYNITVEGDNSYIADGIVVHNCQDLSIAGKQIGLHGSRSGLFFQMIRIIREMLEGSQGQYPHYLIFENVPGLLSSSKGKDIIEVLNSIADLGFVIDVNQIDAQEHNVAQRRKRIFIACINKRYFNPAIFAGIPRERNKRIEKILSDWGGKTVHGITSRPHTPVRQHLSEILEHDVDKRFYLSVAACLGILRRVDSKGKEIPAILRAALENQAGISANKVDSEPHAFNPGICGRLGRKGTTDLAPSLTAHSGDNLAAVCYPIDERNALRKGVDNCGAGIGDEGDAAYTVTAEHQGVIALSHHPSDSRIKIAEDDICQCLAARAGTGGGSVPLVMNERQYAHTVSENMANTLTGTDSKGTQILCIQGSIIGRKPENGANGKGVNEDVAYTLTEVDRHAVCYNDVVGTLDTGLARQNSNQTVQSGKMIVEEVAFGIDRAAYNQGMNALYKPQIDIESTHSLTAQGPGAVAAPPSYVVRRLTPTECLKLMDLPSNWCEGLEIANPTDEDMAFWREVFETHRKINKPAGKPKTDNQIRKFLRSPFSDSACYRMAGNGLVTSVAEFVFTNLLEYDGKFKLFDNYTI